jgi:hypothetical protein
MKFILLAILSLFSISSFAKPVSLVNRLDLLKVLATSKTASTGDEYYKMNMLISDLDKALGGKAEKNMSYSISRLECDDIGRSIKCDVMIFVETYETHSDGAIETFESAVMINAEFLKSGTKFILKDNKVSVTLAG